MTTVSDERPKALTGVDIVCFKTIGDVAVFSTGSMAFCGSLSHNNYENHVSRVLKNVLRRFHVAAL
jgi:N,N-dimethylformamidase